MEEDMEALRALLENIITLSFDEEDSWPLWRTPRRTTRAT